MPRGVTDLLLVAGIILLAAGVTAMVDRVVINRGSGWYDGWHSDALTIGLGIAFLALGRAVRSSE